MLGVPLDWDAATSDQGKTYYYHTTTHETTWECPRKRPTSGGTGPSRQLSTPKRRWTCSTVGKMHGGFVGSPGERPTSRRNLARPVSRLERLCYLFFHVRCGVYCLIHDGEVQPSCPFATPRNSPTRWIRSGSH